METSNLKLALLEMARDQLYKEYGFNLIQLKQKHLVDGLENSNFVAPNIPTQDEILSRASKLLEFCS